MITQEQQQWLDHLSDTDRVAVVPWDPTCEDKFLQIKKQIQSLLGDQQAVEHRGASSLKISGQDEIDIYVPISEKQYNRTVEIITELYGKPRSNYPLKRARFVTFIKNKHIDIFVINSNDNGWKDSKIFNNYLLSNPCALNEYRQLKENSQGKSTKAYYADKAEFINEVLSKARALK